MRGERSTVVTSTLLRLSLAGALAAFAAGCGGGGGGGTTTSPPPPPPPTESYGAAAVTYSEDPCTFAFGVIGTRHTSAASAEADARRRCAGGAETAAAAGHTPLRCVVRSFDQCAAVVAGSMVNPANGVRICTVNAQEGASISRAQSVGLQSCEHLMGLFGNAHCEVLVSACASGTGGAKFYSRGGGNGTAPPPPSDGTTFPDEPRRTSGPQASGSDWPGVEIAGADTTRYVLALNRRSGNVTYRAGTWFEPKDGKYQRMIVAQSTSVQPGQVVQIPTACMQQGNPAPAKGARFFSSPKSTSGSVQQCQRDCLFGGQKIQDCVWACERSTSSPPAPSSVTFRLTDGCNDGSDIQYKFFEYQSADTSRITGQWPASGRVYTTNGLGETNEHALSCTPRRLVCYGGNRRNAPNSGSWGVGIDGSGGCQDCCRTCPDSGTAELGTRLTCN